MLKTRIQHCWSNQESNSGPPAFFSSKIDQKVLSPTPYSLRPKKMPFFGEKRLISPFWVRYVAENINAHVSEEESRKITLSCHIFKCHGNVILTWMHILDWRPILIRLALLFVYKHQLDIIFKRKMLWDLRSTPFNLSIANSGDLKSMRRSYRQNPRFSSMSPQLY